MRQELIEQHRLQKALWCGKGACPSIHDRWAGLRDEIITHTKEKKVAEVVKEITHRQHNPFSYPNEERCLWLELEGNGNRKYYEKEKADVVYFVGCKTSFVISQHHQALDVLKDLKETKTDFAILGHREWCCGMPLKKIGMDEEFEDCIQHNLRQIRRLGAKQVIFSCPSCYATWQQEYQPEGIELILHGFSKEGFEINGKTYKIDENSYLQNPDEWNKDVAEYMAEIDGVKLTSEHWKVINFIRDYYQEYQYSPALKVIAKEMGKRLGSEKGSKRYFFQLFPRGPYRQGYKIAGVPMPFTTCEFPAPLMRWYLWSKTYEGIGDEQYFDTCPDPPWLQPNTEDSKREFWQ